MKTMQMCQQVDLDVGDQDQVQVRYLKEENDQLNY